MGRFISSYGRLLTNDELVKFKEAFGNKTNDFIDSGSNYLMIKRLVNSLSTVDPLFGSS